MSEFPFDDFKETDFNEFERFFKTNTVNPIYDHRANFQTNAPSFYEYLAKHNHLIKILAQRIYDYDKELAKRFLEWDKRIENLPDELQRMFLEWVDDGTLARILAQLLLDDYATKEEVNGLIETLETDLNQKFNDLYNDVNELLINEVINKKIKSENAVYQNKLTELVSENSDENAPQGLAYVKHDGIEKIFVLSNVTRITAYDENERQVITEYHLEDNNTLSQPIHVSEVLNLTHQGLSAHVHNNEIYLYAGMNTGNGNENGKGISIIKWNESNTNQNNVRRVRLFGKGDTNHIFSNHQKAIVSVSDDGRYIILNSVGYEAAVNNVVFVYDLEEVLNSNDSLNLRPLNVFNVTNPPKNASHSIQDMTCDGNYIYLYRGGVKTLGTYISIYSVNGIFVGEYNVEGVLSEFSEYQMSNESDLGEYLAIEPEGIAIRNNNIIILCFTYWRNNQTGVTIRKRFLYELTNVKRENSKPINRGILPLKPPSTLHLYGNKYDITYPQHETFNISGYNENTREVIPVFDIQRKNIFKFYDGDNYDVNNGEYGSIITQYNDTQKVMLLRATNAISSGAGINLYKKDSVNGDRSGDLVLYSIGDSENSVLLKSDGNLIPNIDGTQSLGRTTRKWKDIHATNGVIITSDERKKKNIKPINDTLLDAWLELSYKEFEYINIDDDKKRVGLIAQDIISVFEKYNLNIDDYNIIKTEKINDDEILSVNTNEVMMIENALLRRELNKLKGV